jgi:hypothetical protein
MSSTNDDLRQKRKGDSRWGYVAGLYRTLDDGEPASV